jgi:protein-S-isoprenylcysteine O-methyltransferase Ste14
MPIWLRAALFIAFVPGTIAGWLPWYIAGAQPVPPGGRVVGVRLLGAILVAGGWSALMWCAVDFARRGRGTPAPYDAPRTLVISGLYRITRNPMYLSVLAAIIGHALLFQSRAVAIYAVVFALCCHAMVVLYEEPRLAREFGDAYAEYRERVPRWGGWWFRIH